MSLTLNMVGGGGGSLKNTDAILLVTVPRGSSVTATKNGITLTPTMWMVGGSLSLDVALFTIKPSTFSSASWTVTATINGHTVSDSIVIDAAKAYELTLSYEYVLYKNGTEYVDITLNTAGGATATKQTTYINAAVSSSSMAVKVYPTSSISLADYSSLSCTIDIISWSGSQSAQIAGLSIRASASGSATSQEYFSNATGEQTITLDISGQTGSFFTMFTLAGAAGSMNAHLLDMRLLM